MSEGNAISTVDKVNICLFLKRFVDIPYWKTRIKIHQILSQNYYLWRTEDVYNLILSAEKKLLKNNFYNRFYN